LFSSKTRIQVVAATDGMTVYIDDTFSSTVRKTGRVFSKIVSAGDHVVIAHKEGYWPWSETVHISEGESVRLHPFLFREEYATEVVPSDTAEYERIQSLF